MLSFPLLLSIISIGSVFFLIAYRRASFPGWDRRIHSRAYFHAVLVFLLSVFPALILWAAYSLVFHYFQSGFLGGAASSEKFHGQLSLATMIFLVGCTALACAFYGLKNVKPDFPARERVEKCVLFGLASATLLSVLVSLGIFACMFFESLAFFREISPFSFFFGLVWDPRFVGQGAHVSSGQFGLLPLLAGTLYIALIALMVAIPVGLMSAVYMSEYASSGTRSFLKPMLELLAGIPSIVHGIFALLILGPFLKDFSSFLAGGQSFIGSQSILTAGIAMGVMLVPVVASLSDDMMTAVPSMMRDASLALGATRSETICRVIIPTALPGIGAAILLAASRAVGETMIVVLAAGVAPNLTANPFEAMTTITVKIVNQLTGDLEFDSPLTRVAFALGVTLFVLTFLMNMIAHAMVRRYRRYSE